MRDRNHITETLSKKKINCISEFKFKHCLLEYSVRHIKQIKFLFDTIAVKCYNGFYRDHNNNNKPSAIPQVGSEEVGCMQTLILFLWGGEVVFDRP